MYRRNFDARMGLDWQTAFQTDTPAGVHEYCRSHGMTYRWKPDGRLSTEHVAPAFITHPKTAEPLWFNHATFFHVTTLPPAIRQALHASYGEDDLPNNTYYGDGRPIEPDVLDTLRGIYQEAMVTFRWERGDVLMVDNLLAVHARRSYTGSRRILVAMAEPLNAHDVAFQVEGGWP
jgi:alpha-ketoglutarate-dependent taurine dioxygenase